MAATVEVSFKGIRKEFFQWQAEQEPLRLRDAVIVETDRGHDFGRISAVGDPAARKCGGCSGCGTDTDTAAPETRPLPAVVRLATPDDVRQADELRRAEEEIRREVTQKVRIHQLDMRISDAEWQWDRKKLTVYFTAEHRVDFRSLVRELAAQYRTRIELRQIGVRDEAARLGGVGRCGREFCCSTWLKDLSPVSLSLAKDQHLSLNPSQISGGCGRLLCCLRYEHEFYVASRKRFPKEGKALRTSRGTEKVIAVDIFRERVFLRGEEGPRTVLLTDLRTELDSLGEELPLPGARPVVTQAAAPPVQPPVPALAAAPPDSPSVQPREGARKRRRRRRGRRGDGKRPDES